MGYMLFDWVLDWFPDWRDARVRKALERAEFERLVAAFLKDTEPLAPAASKHPDVACLRFGWKRAVALQHIYRGRQDEVREAFYARLRKHLAEAYYRVAPHGPYGQAKLKMDEAASEKMLRAELARLALLSCPECHDADDAFEPRIQSPVDCPRCGTRFMSGVYILSNPSMPGLVKIGHTTTSLSERMAQLSAPTAVPKPFALEAWFPCSPGMAKEHEKQLHKHFYSRQVKGREFFSLDVSEAIETAEQMIGMRRKLRR